MIALDKHEALQELCLARGKWGLVCEFGEMVTPEEIDEVLKAIPWLSRVGNHLQILADGIGFFLFPTEEEMREHYEQIVGDDGPTDRNPYDGPARVYALTCDSWGTLLSENT